MHSKPTCETFWKIITAKTFSKFPGKHARQSPLLNKVSSNHSATILKIQSVPGILPGIKVFENSCSTEAEIT